MTESAVKIEGLDPRDEIQPLRKHHLKNVSRRNVFFAALHAAQKIGARGSGVDLQLSGLGFFGFAPHRWTQARSQLLLQRGNVT